MTAQGSTDVNGPRIDGPEDTARASYFTTDEAHSLRELGDFSSKYPSVVVPSVLFLKLVGFYEQHALR